MSQTITEGTLKQKTAMWQSQVTVGMWESTVHLA